MRTIVITGGTSGIGEGVAQHYLDHGDRAVVIGHDPTKGAAFLEAARAAGAGQRADFIVADLSLVSENRRVVEDLADRVGAIDALVLCARYFRSARAVTPEGIEHNLALYYLSRHQLGAGLLPLLERADRPVIVNVAGPGVGPGHIRWDDLGLEHKYDGWTAMFQGGRLNDLLGVGFTARHPGVRTRYVLHFPGGTSTGFAGELDAATADHVAGMLRDGQPVTAAIAPILSLIDDPPPEPLTAVALGRPISLGHPFFDRAAAERLETLTAEMLSL